MFSRIRNTVARLYDSAVLLVLPEVETVLTGLAKAITFLQVREAALERHIENRIEAIVEDGKRYYAKQNANLSAVGNARKEAEAAVAARTAVEKLINRG